MSTRLPTVGVAFAFGPLATLLTTPQLDSIGNTAIAKKIGAPNFTY
jgi:hypothetical protein